MQPAGGFDLRAITEEPCDGRGVERGRHHENFQFWPQFGLQPADNCQGQIGVERSLVKFIEHDQTDAFQQRIVLQHPHEQPVGQSQDSSLAARLAFEANLIADLLPQRRATLFGHPPGGGSSGNPPRLEQHDLPVAGEARIEQGRGDTRRLARARGSAQHGGAVAPQRRDNLRQDFVDRQFGQMHARSLTETRARFAATQKGALFGGFRGMVGLRRSGLYPR